MTALSSAAAVLDTLHATFTAAHYDAVALFQPSGEVVAHAGDWYGRVDPDAQFRFPGGRLEPAVTGHVMEHLPLEGYGACLGALVAIVRQEPADPAAATAALRSAASMAEQLGILDYEVENLSSELVETYESLDVLCDVTAASARSKSVSDLCAILLELLGRQVTSRAGAILLGTELEESIRELRVQAAFGTASICQQGERIPVNEDWAQMLESHGPLLWDHARENAPASLQGLAEQSLLVAPLRAQGRSIGLLMLMDHRAGAGLTCFNSRDRKLADAVATQGGAMILGMRLIEVSKELEIGRRIQQSLLPDKLPQPPGLEVSGLCSMARVVGGDFYDAAVGSDGELRAVIADVSGHDLGAALLMAAARSIFRSELNSDRGPAEIVTRVNQLLHEDLQRAGLFLTFFVVAIHPESRLLRYSAGGHNPPLLYRAKEERLQVLPSPGMPAGLTPHAHFPEKTEQLGEGDVLFLYTDGLTEARSPAGAMYGEQRLGEALLGHRSLEANRLVREMEQEIRAFAGGGELQDDGTALVVKVGKPPQEPVPATAWQTKAELRS